MWIKGILFDADGVVIHSEMFSVQYQKEYDISGDDMIPFFKGDFQDCIIGKADLIEVVTPWLEKWKWNGTVHEFLQFWFKSEHTTDERMVANIKSLRKIGIRCYLATNQEKYRIHYMKNDMGFEELFDKVFSSAEIGHKKPDKQFYKFILEEIKKDHEINPDEIMYFDDSQENVVEAKKLDIKAHLYHNIEEFENLVKSSVNTEALN